ncbi:hypothetical protein MXD63_14365 [Frankia sp. Cpl3]|nr:hypothetical protein [Frankia sp. Cpl3]
MADLRALVRQLRSLTRRAEGGTVTQPPPGDSRPVIGAHGAHDLADLMVGPAEQMERLVGGLTTVPNPLCVNPVEVVQYGRPTQWLCGCNPHDQATGGMLGLDPGGG